MLSFLTAWFLAYLNITLKLQIPFTNIPSSPHDTSLGPFIDYENVKIIENFFERI